MKMSKPLSLLQPVLVAGFLFAAGAHGALASQSASSHSQALAPAQHSVSAPADYMYHGRRYPYRFGGNYFYYRYGGRYYNHRAWRNGRWRYY